MTPTRGAGVTAAAGTSLSHHLFSKIFTLGKSPTCVEHLGFPYHSFLHCKGFAPAAPRRAGTSFSVSLSGLPLSRPVRIFGLVGHYPTNNLIRRCLIHRRRSFKRKIIPDIFSYKALSPVFRGYSLPMGRLSTCY